MVFLVLLPLLTASYVVCMWLIRSFRIEVLVLSAVRPQVSKPFKLACCICWTQQYAMATGHTSTASEPCCISRADIGLLAWPPFEMYYSRWD